MSELGAYVGQIRAEVRRLPSGELYFVLVAQNGDRPSEFTLETTKFSDADLDNHGIGISLFEEIPFVPYGITQLQDWVTRKIEKPATDEPAPSKVADLASTYMELADSVFNSCRAEDFIKKLVQSEQLSPNLQAGILQALRGEHVTAIMEAPVCWCNMGKVEGVNLFIHESNITRSGEEEPDVFAHEGDEEPNVS